MNKSNIVFLVIFFLVVGAFFVLLSTSRPQTRGEKIGLTSSVINADKVEIIHFHATQQCWACLTVGEYVLKTIEEEFSQEYEEGVITFQTLNVESPENRDLVSKYQARGSSVFVNAIVDGEQNIEEDINVWRYINNEEAFIEYFAGKLHKILGE